MSEPSQAVIAIVGAHVGGSVSYYGLPETAQRLSHALAEIAAVLDTNDPRLEPRDVAQQASQKAKDTLKEWGVA